MKKVSFFSIIAVCIPTISFAAPLAGLTSFFQSIVGVEQTVIPAFFGLAVVYFFYGMGQFILHDAGNDKTREDGKKKMLWGVIAIFVMASLYGIIFFIGQSLGISTGMTGTDSSVTGSTDTNCALGDQNCGDGSGNGGPSDTGFVQTGSSGDTTNPSSTPCANPFDCNSGGGTTDTGTVTPSIESSGPLYDVMAVDAPITKTVTVGKTSYSVTYSYLPDGEVRASVTYNGKPYAIQNYNTVGYSGIGTVQSDGSFGHPWTGSADLTLIQLANQISIASPSSEIIFSGFTFTTPLWVDVDTKTGYVSIPTSAFETTQSFATNVPVPALYKLDADSNNTLVGVIPVNISNSGVITYGAEIFLQKPAISNIVPTSPALISASELRTEIMDQYKNGNPSIDSIATLATKVGYLVYENSDKSSLIIRDPVTYTVVATMSEASD